MWPIVWQFLQVIQWHPLLQLPCYLTTLLTHPAIHHQIGKPLAHWSKLHVLADYFHDQLHVLVVHLQHNMERATEHIDHSLEWVMITMEPEYQQKREISYLAQYLGSRSSAQWRAGLHIPSEHDMADLPAEYATLLASTGWTTNPQYQI